MSKHVLLLSFLLAILIAPFNDVPSRSVAAPATAPALSPATAPAIKTIVWPDADPQACKPAHERAKALLAEFEKLVDPQVRAAAEDFVSHRAGGVSPAKAYDDFAVALLLMG